MPELAPTCRLSFAAEIRSLSHEVGLNLRKIRLEYEFTQDDLALGVQAAGLDWTRNTIAALESGRRELRADELFLLPLAVDRSGLGEISFRDLLPAAEILFSLGNLSAIRGKQLQDLIWEAAEPNADRDDPGGTAPLSSHPREWNRFKPAMEWARAKWPEVGEKTIEAIVKDSRRTAEVRAARRLNVSPEKLALVCHQLWGMGLTEKRDSILDELLGRPSQKGPDPRGYESLADYRKRRRASSGHVVRNLTHQLSVAIEAEGSGT